MVSRPSQVLPSRTTLPMMWAAEVAGVGDLDLVAARLGFSDDRRRHVQSLHKVLEVAALAARVGAEALDHQPDAGGWVVRQEWPTCRCVRIRSPESLLPVRADAGTAC